LRTDGEKCSSSSVKGVTEIKNLESSINYDATRKEASKQLK